MSTATPFIGIDFGTSKSTMAWFNPESGQAEILRNAEGKDETPSVVYFGPGERLRRRSGGDDAGGSGEAADGRAERQARPRQPAEPGAAERPGQGDGRGGDDPGKLRRDAEELHFHRPVQRAVLTYPAAFDEMQLDKIREAAASGRLHRGGDGPRAGRGGPGLRPVRPRAGPPCAGLRSRRRHLRPGAAGPRAERRLPGGAAAQRAGPLRRRRLRPRHLRSLRRGGRGHAGARHHPDAGRPIRSSCGSAGCARKPSPRPSAAASTPICRHGCHGGAGALQLRVDARDGSRR